MERLDRVIYRTTTQEIILKEYPDIAAAALFAICERAKKNREADEAYLLV